MKISVVIPTYQRPVLLMKCLNALLHQAFPPAEYEIIVVSDGPDEKTKEVLPLNAGNIPVVRFLFLPVKSGPAAARNLGWRKARSRFIAFTDDDCIPSEDWLITLWNAYWLKQRTCLAFTGKTIVPISKVPTDYELNISHLSRAEFITANCACSRTALERVEGFDEQFTMAWREDSDLHFKFLKQRIPIIPVKNAVVTHPVRAVPWGISLKEEKKGVFNALLYKKYPDLYRQKIRRKPPWHYYAIIISVIVFFTGMLSAMPALALAGFAGWLLLTGSFIMRRLRNTSHDAGHIFEMVITSLVIPFLSLYWRFYGSWKFKVPLVP